MTNQPIETSPQPVSSKAMRNLLEISEAQNRRLNIVEQQFLDLFARMNQLENANNRKR